MGGGKGRKGVAAGSGPHFPPHHFHTDFPHRCSHLQSDPGRGRRVAPKVVEEELIIGLRGGGEEELVKGLGCSEGGG